MALSARGDIPRCYPRRAFKEVIESWDDLFLSGSDNGKEHEPCEEDVFRCFNVLLLSFTSDNFKKCGESRTFRLRALWMIGRQGPSPAAASSYEKRMELASDAASLSAYQRTE